MRRGVSLIEALVALAILGILATVIASFVVELRSNSRSEQRAQAVALAQQRLEALRGVDPATLPVSGCDPDQTASAAPWTFQVRVCYCTQAALCSSTAKQVRVEVRLVGQPTPIYAAETVYTQLR